MADATDKKAPEVFKMVEREGVSMPFVMAEKSRGPETYPVDEKTKKEDKSVLLKGEKYPTTYVTPDNVLDWIKWLSLKIAANKIGAFLNQYCQRIAEAVKEQNDGKFDEATWLNLIPELSFRGEKLSVLQEDLLSVIDQMSSVPDEMLDTPEGIKQFRELRAEADRLKTLIRDKKRSPREAKEGSTDPEAAAVA